MLRAQGPGRRSARSAVRKPRCLTPEMFKTVIIPEIPARQAKDFYAPFRPEEPGCRAKTEIGLVYGVDNGARNRLTRNLAFAKRPVIADDKNNRSSQEKEKRS